MTSKDWVSAEKQDKNSDQIDKLKNQENVPKLRFPSFNTSWKKYRLRDIVKFLDNKRIPLNEDTRNNQDKIYPYYGASGIIDYVEDYIFDEELILLGEDGTIDVNLASGKYWVSNHAHVLKANNNINQHLLYEFLKTVHFEKYNTGTIQPKLNKETCKSIPILIPDSKLEQYKIADFLFLINKKIELMERKHKLIKKYKNGLMHEIFTQNIKFSNNELCLFKLGEIVELMRNGSNELQVNFKTEFPVTRIETISKGNINFDKVGFVETIDKSYQLKKGDILLSNINSLKYIGNCVYFDTDKILYHGMNLMLIRFKENFNKKFLYYYIKYHKKWFQRMACQAVNQASINQTSLKKFPFVIPKLKTDQDKIANFLSKIDNKINSVEQQLEKIKEFKKYLLQQMFV